MDVTIEQTQKVEWYSREELQARGWRVIGSRILDYVLTARLEGWRAARIAIEEDYGPDAEAVFTGMLACLLYGATFYINQN